MEQIKLKAGLAYALVLFLGITAAFSYYFYDRYINTDHFLPGVEIGGIPVQGYNLEEAAAVVSQTILAMNDSRVTFYKDDFTYQTKLGDLCQPLDPGKIVESAWKQEQSRNWRAKIVNIRGIQKLHYPVNIIYDPAIRDKLVQEWNTKWGVPPRDASLEIDSKRGLMVIPAQSGMLVDADITFNALPAYLGAHVSPRMPIIIASKEPQIKEAMLSNMGELSSFSTSFNTKDSNRSHNLSLAAANINKAMVAPQAIFSFNETVGQRTMERGYLDAMVIVGGKFEPGLGGGICQVSTTLYNACLLAGLEIAERNNHNLAVAYVPLGRDATVSYGTQDFKFKNNTDYPIYIRAVTSGSTLTINIYGNLKYKQKISISNAIDQTINFNTITQRDSSLQPGTQKVTQNGQSGYVVRTFRTFYSSDGKITRTEQLARDSYQSLNKIVTMGPDPVPVPDPPVTPPSNPEPPPADPPPSGDQGTPPTGPSGGSQT